MLRSAHLLPLRAVTIHVSINTTVTTVISVAIAKVPEQAEAGDQQHQPSRASATIALQPAFMQWGILSGCDCLLCHPSPATSGRDVIFSNIVEHVALAFAMFLEALCKSDAFQLRAHSSTLSLSKLPLVASVPGVKKFRLSITFLVGA